MTVQSRGRRAYRDSALYYSEGSAARAPQRIDEVQNVRRRSHYTYEKRRAMFGVGYCIMFFLSLAVTVCVAYFYIYMFMQTSKAKSMLANKESQLVQIREENSLLRDKLNDDMDLSELYEKATAELGMVYPAEDQILSYSSEDGDYIRQYGEIPREK